MRQVTDQHDAQTNCLVWTSLLPFHSCDVMCFEVMCFDEVMRLLWGDLWWVDVVICDVWYYVIWYYFMLCSLIILSLFVVLPTFYCVMRREVRHCYIIWSKMMLWNLIGRNGVGLGRARCRKPNFLCQSAFSRSALVTPRAVMCYHVMRSVAGWIEVMWLGVRWCEQGWCG